MMKKYYLLIMLGAVAGIIMFTCIAMLISGKASIVINGFAVDVDNQLYVGKGKEIVVLKDGAVVRTIDPPTSRTYKFTIVDGKTILLSTSTKVYMMDLYGNIISESIDEGTKTYNRLQWKKIYMDERGSEYTLESRWGRTRILKEGVSIYEMPMRDYIVRILFITAFVAVFVLGIVAAVMRVSRST